MIKMIDLFAGAGGFRLASEQNNLECVFTCEIDKFARKTYEHNFTGRIEAHDIKDVKTLPDHNILMAGFPCPAFSLAGINTRRYLNQPSGFEHPTGSLFFEIIRLAKLSNPDVLLLENVKNLVNHNKGKTFSIMRAALESLNYNVYYKVIDSRYYVQQRRERIFIVATKFNKEFIFPDIPVQPVFNLSNILESNVSDKYTLSDRWWQGLKNHKTKHKKRGNGFGYKLVHNNYSNPLPTLVASNPERTLLYQPYKNPRKLTPREQARLMGFPDSFEFPVSNTQAYRQMGNSVVVPVIYDIIKTIKGTYYECKN